MTIIDEIESAGQSLWYDNIERAKLLDGSLAEMIDKKIIKGITSNPSIFQKAISTSKAYDVTLKPMAWAGWGSEQIFWQLAVEDIKLAAQLFLPLYLRSGGADGFVSLEVNPLIAHDTVRTIEEAARLWRRVQMPNLMIKIPATREGIPAIRKSIADGLNINVTLIFSIDRYKEVMDAYLSGLEDRVKRGEPVDRIASVASFFISRIDTSIDKLLQDRVENDVISKREYDELAGRAAIANARLAYQQFEEVFGSERFRKLEILGAKPQRPLWASTSTKNPSYRDVIYIEELIAANSVNTVPPATLEVFIDHGIVAVKIREGLDEALNHFHRLEDRGISIKQVSSQLETDGVKAFADAFVSLLEAVEKRRLAAAEEAASLRRPIIQKIEELQEENFGQRLHQKDPSLWTEDPQGQAEIKLRMNWLETPFENRDNPPVYSKMGSELLAAGFTHAVLLGMGGSSLAPEVMKNILASGEPQSGLKLSILDSTDPLQVRAITDNSPALQTLYIVASKSGTTGEINALLEHFWKRTKESGNSQPGQQFIAVTDPGTRLEILAKERGFRAVVNADPQVGGRNSALTAFGLVPAAIMGLDLDRIIKNAVNLANLCSVQQPIEANPGLVLGVIIGTAALGGKDKVTLITEGKWTAFGDWLEQLIAESSGKDGKGILPVTDEAEMGVENYSADRLFIYLDYDNSKEKFVDSLKIAGHPVIALSIQADEDLAGQFYLWEIAVATACSLLGVNSFDQPDVQDAKLRTLAGLEAYRKTGTLPQASTAVRFASASILGEVSVESTQTRGLNNYIEESISRCSNTTEYVAINAFLPKNPENEENLRQLRRQIGDRFHVATTLGFGPRYLHSTGQLHKGGPNTGYYLLITSQRQDDLDIPELGVSFGVMQRAQAIGDLQALQAKGRNVLWIDLNKPDARLLLED